MKKNNRKNRENLDQVLTQTPKRPFLDQVLTLQQIYIYIYIYICNLIWWAVLGFQDVMKQHERRRNKEKKTKNLRKKKPKWPTKTATILWRFLLAIFDYKTGDFLRYWAFLCPPIEVTAIYIYIYVAMESYFEGPFLPFGELIPVPRF